MTDIAEQSELEKAFEQSCEQLADTLDQRKAIASTTEEFAVAIKIAFTPLLEELIKIENLSRSALRAAGTGSLLQRPAYDPSEEELNNG